MKQFRALTVGLLCLTAHAYANENEAGNFVDIPLVSRVSSVQPMTGIVLWEASHNNSLLKTSDKYTQLEFSYVKPNQIVTSSGVYDWSSVETILNNIEARSKQAVLRLSYVLPGQQTTVPNYIKALENYNETSGLTEGQRTYFPDWSNATLQAAHKDLYTAFAARYNNDPRLAFLQIGFGLWGEYHIYQPSVSLGVNFPSKAYQASTIEHANNVFDDLQWSISIDAGVDSVSPFSGNSRLLNLNFGLFDDSFLHQGHSGYNESMWNRLDYSNRYESAVLGGEINYYTPFDQQRALNPNGIHGTTFAEQSSKFHITYMLGNDQPSHQSNERIRNAGLNTGYRFEITSFQANSNQSRVTVKNNGVAPIYYDAHISVNGVLSNASLKGLLPGDSAVFTVASGGTRPNLSIESDRLVRGQKIEFDANL